MKHLSSHPLLSATALLAALSLTLLTFTQCKKTGADEKETTEATETAKPRPLNLSVYLDLSNRLVRPLVPSQMSRDTAIINHLTEIFIRECLDRKNGGLIKSTNHMQIFFYPPTTNSNVAALAADLNVDLKQAEAKDKRRKLLEMKERFAKNLSLIYENTLQEQKWIGSDVWGFFSNKKVDAQCVRSGYRNILVILTDGFLYDTATKLKDADNGYSYVLPQMLDVPNAHLITKRDGLEALEVLMLEVNPYQPTQRDPMKNILQRWFGEMGVKHCVLVETDLPSNVRSYVDSFFYEPGE